ncbi:protein-tyrosine phosphatase [Planifilum fulgidum]|jgi:protein-tyrosine-phosphatase|uniref:Protein-tyrosine phosphatase n=1 Tax=Planifilum fulgidum TaxID=201973 RepID=A0A1I2LR10_9BACL|nr:low molecular weight phosphatase family protein [Bacillota bacterium]MBO2531385.1 low molecular weight phosphatase family protein [Thermoactinomycetaceae bacterium]SFF79827.1 protein-tyrosine phosphatase [Planifilum fulgidum]
MDPVKNVLLVCTGNTCRSPMAEAILARLAGEEGLKVSVRSAGLFAMDGAEASENTRRVLGERGIRFSHRARSIRPELIDWADLILTMTLDHKRRLISMNPESVGKVFTLKEYALTDGETRERIRRLEQMTAELETRRALGSGKGKSSDAGDAIRSLEESIRREREALEKEGVPLEDLDIPDPFGGDLETYRRCADRLEELLRRIVERWRREEETRKDGH